MKFLKEIPEKRRNLPYRKIEGNFYIVDPESKKLHELNEVASFVWQNINGKNSWEEILKKILENFEVERDVALKDLMELRESFLKKNLIEI